MIKSNKRTNITIFDKKILLMESAFLYSKIIAIDKSALLSKCEKYLEANYVEA